MQSTPEERAQSRARLEELIKEYISKYMHVLNLIFRLRTLNESIPEPTAHSEEKEEKVEEPEVPKQV